MPTRTTFAFDFDPRFRGLLRLLTIRPENSLVAVDDTTFDVRFGPWRLTTPVDNLADVTVTRGYRWFKVIGPRGSAVDRGCTFGTNARAGVCVHFHEPVPALLPTDVRRHPGLTVTVADVDGLVAAVRAHLDGEDPAAP